MARTPLPVTAELALALAREGDIFACAEKLAALDDADLRPVAVLMTDILRPLIAMGAVTPARMIDRDGLLRLGVGALGLREEDLWRRMTLEALAAACVHWRQSATPPDRPTGEFLKDMAARFPDTGKGENI